MIGYYVHHQGHGHRHRAAAIAHHLPGPVVGLSSASRPAGWAGPWVELPSDADGPHPVRPSASGRLHWVPEHDSGLLGRMALISDWLRRDRPALVVVDVSVEVALLCRLHGIPVITMILPGDRSDPAHRLVHDIARRVLAAWPAEAEDMASGIDGTSDITHVGAISRFDGRDVPTHPRGSQRRATLLLGGGGSSLDPDAVDRMRASTPGWHWTVLGGPGTAWSADPWPALCAADVVLTHGGQNALAEVAAARRPAVVFAEDRPHDEQHATISALRHGPWPAITLPSPVDGVADALAAADRLDGSAWASWNDGAGAARAAAIIENEARS